jgi:hypothetical protein
MRNGTLKQHHYTEAEKHLHNLFKLWDEACLSFTPKVHSLLTHALEQMKRFDGFGDTLEDDIEHMHQISASLEAQVGQMKNKEQQALIHSKMEAVQSNEEVHQNVERIKVESKRNFKKRNFEICAETRAKKLKEERDERRAQAAISIQQTSYSKLISQHDETMAQALITADLNNGASQQTS